VKKPERENGTFIEVTKEKLEVSEKKKSPSISPAKGKNIHVTIPHIHVTTLYVYPCPLICYYYSYKLFRLYRRKMVRERQLI